MASEEEPRSGATKGAGVPCNLARSDDIFNWGPVFAL
jgi:hypothetical protein